MNKLLTLTESGLYCPQADIYIDPWMPVDKAIITHAHKDHARIGHKIYYAEPHTCAFLRYRFGKYIDVHPLNYHQPLIINGVRISLHPSGHIFGSAQVRVEFMDEVWVFSGDYKLSRDGFSTPFEAVPCDVFISESLYGMPHYQWPDQDVEVQAIRSWWRENRAQGRYSILVAHPMGKSQRILNHLQAEEAPIYIHTEIHKINSFLQELDVHFENNQLLTDRLPHHQEYPLIVIPPSSVTSRVLKNYRPASVAIASGMALTPDRILSLGFDRGFVISEHADWNELNEAIRLSGAGKVILTNGYSVQFSDWLRTTGMETEVWPTQFNGELAEFRSRLIPA